MTGGEEGSRVIAEYQKKSNIGVGVGFVIAVGGRLLALAGASSQSQGLAGLGIAGGLVGTAIFIWGCVNYAQGKGYSPWLGALGLMSCIGLIILVILPDKRKDGGFGGPGIGGPPASGPPPGAFGNEPPPPAQKTLGGDEL